MISQISRLAFRNFTTKTAPKPLGYERIGSNLPFSIHNANALTIKFLLFFGSAFYIPFIALYVQTKRYFKGHEINEESEKFQSLGIYGLACEEHDQKSPEIYI